MKPVKTIKTHSIHKKTYSLDINGIYYNGEFEETEFIYTEKSTGNWIDITECIYDNFSCEDIAELEDKIYS